jgi:cell division protein YceG involved in septum cleavage
MLLTVQETNNEAITVSDGNMRQMFERESRREKIIEGKMREIRLRVKTRQSEQHSAGSRESRPSVTHPSAADLLLQAAEEEFFQIIEEVRRFELLL